MHLLEFHYRRWRFGGWHWFGKIIHIIGLSNHVYTLHYIRDRGDGIGIRGYDTVNVHEQNPSFINHS